MKCKLVQVPSEAGSERTFCEAHGVYMDPLMGQIGDASCPIGYLADVERRFHDTAQEFDASVKAIHAQLSNHHERLQAIEGELGIKDPALQDPVDD